jgi:hypothetical protein
VVARSTGLAHFCLPACARLPTAVQHACLPAGLCMLVLTLAWRGVRSEDTELTFFSVFNQAVAHVVHLLHINAIQGHDCECLACSRYLPLSGIAQKWHRGQFDEPAHSPVLLLQTMVC